MSIKNLLNGVQSQIFTSPNGDRYSVSLPPGFLINSDGIISSTGFSEYDDWKKVADEIADAAPCRHEWVNVGFHFDKWVCKKCDVNKGSNE